MSPSHASTAQLPPLLKLQQLKLFPDAALLNGLRHIGAGTDSFGSLGFKHMAEQLGKDVKDMIRQYFKKHQELINDIDACEKCKPNRLGVAKGAVATACLASLRTIISLGDLRKAKDDHVRALASQASGPTSAAATSSTAGPSHSTHTSGATTDLLFAGRDFHAACYVEVERHNAILARMVPMHVAQCQPDITVLKDQFLRVLAAAGCAHHLYVSSLPATLSQSNPSTNTDPVPTQPQVTPSQPAQPKGADDSLPGMDSNAPPSHASATHPSSSHPPAMSHQPFQASSSSTGAGLFNITVPQPHLGFPEANPQPTMDLQALHDEALRQFIPTFEAMSATQQRQLFEQYPELLITPELVDIHRRTLANDPNPAPPTPAAGMSQRQRAVAHALAPPSEQTEPFDVNWLSIIDRAPTLEEKAEALVLLNPTNLSELRDELLARITAIQRGLASQATRTAPGVSVERVAHVRAQLESRLHQDQALAGLIELWMSDPTARGL